MCPVHSCWHAALNTLLFHPGSVSLHRDRNIDFMYKVTHASEADYVAMQQVHFWAIKWCCKKWKLINSTLIMYRYIDGETLFQAFWKNIVIKYSTEPLHIFSQSKESVPLIAYNLITLCKYKKYLQMWWSYILICLTFTCWMCVCVCVCVFHLIALVV